MRKAMYEAELGDDVFGDDPTVNALQQRAAELLGKEAALFVASGSMANLVSQLAHLGRGQETIAGASTHIVDDEQAGHAVVVGTSVKQMAERPNGTWDLDELEAAFRDPDDPHQPISGLVTIENTHAHSMAQPLSLGYTQAVADIAHAHGVPLHVDGARFFNAAVALGVTPKQLAVGWPRGWQQWMASNQRAAWPSRRSARSTRAAPIPTSSSSASVATAPRSSTLCGLAVFC
jgi:threonine aldolase